MPKRSFISLAIVLAFAMVANAQAGQFLILAGVGIGSVKVGMQVTDVVAILGTPKTVQAVPSGKIVRYYWFDSYTVGDTRYSPTGGGLYLGCDATGKVLTVVAYSNPKYVTDRGLHTGMTEVEVRSTMGEPTKVNRNANDTHNLIYSVEGKAIMFGINDNHKWGNYEKVYLISVFQETE